MSTPVSHDSSLAASAAASSASHQEAAPRLPAAFPRPYEPEDLHGLKKSQLADLVVRQMHLWPPLAPGKQVTVTNIKRDLNKDALIAGLLDKKYGFTTYEPRQSTRSQSSLVPQSALNLNIPNSSEPVPPPAPLTSESTTSLTVFVHDLRTAAAAGKSRGQVANIRVPCVLTTSLPVAPVFVSAKDVMRELQKTNAAIRGSKTVTVSQQHPQYADYEVTFATAFDPDNVEGTVYSPETLDFPPNGHLFLDVDKSSEEPEEQKTSASAREPNESTESNRTDARARAEVVDWLQRELQTREGYEDFKTAHRHALQNPEIVKRWCFMSEFANEYKKKRPNSSKKSRFPTLEELARALGYSSSTTLKSALSAYRLVENYTERKVQQVMDEIERIEDPPGGAKVLTKFLQDFVE